ncbi:hypothetical protein D3C76_10340 [compost metagenome]
MIILEKYIKEVLQEYNDKIHITDFWNWLVRRRYKKINIFRHEIKVPIKYAKEFEEKIDLLQVTMAMTDVDYVVKSNHTRMRVVIYKEKQLDIIVDFDVYYGVAVIHGKLFKRGSKLMRITIRKPFTPISGFSRYENVIRKSKDFNKIIDLIEV